MNEFIVILYTFVISTSITCVLFSLSL